MATWQLIALSVAGLIVVVILAVLLIKRIYHITSIELGIPPRITMALKDKTTPKVADSRTVQARRNSKISNVDMTDPVSGKKLANAEDESTIEGIKM